MIFFLNPRLLTPEGNPRWQLCKQTGFYFGIGNRSFTDLYLENSESIFLEPATFESSILQKLILLINLHIKFINNYMYQSRDNWVLVWYTISMADVISQV